jgi:hypothetical protein
VISVWWALLLSVGCIKSRAPTNYVGDPEAVVAIARTRPRAEGLRARFSVKIKTPDMGGTTVGSVIIGHPDRIRVEIYTPFGSPLFYLVSDGQSLHAWQHRDRIFYRGDDAGEVLSRLTGGAVGIDDVIALITARLPMPSAEILHTGQVVFAEGGVVLELKGPEEVTVRAVVDPATGMVVRLRVWAGEMAPRDYGDGLIMDVHYEGRSRAGKVRLPKQVKIELPVMEWTITLNIKSWSEYLPPDATFQLVPPVGATQVELVEALKKMAEKRAARP